MILPLRLLRWPMPSKDVRRIKRVILHFAFLILHFLPIPP